MAASSANFHAGDTSETAAKRLKLYSLHAEIKALDDVPWCTRFADCFILTYKTPISDEETPSLVKIPAHRLHLAKLQYFDSRFREGWSTGNIEIVDMTKEVWTSETWVFILKQVYIVLGMADQTPERMFHRILGGFLSQGSLKWNSVIPLFCFLSGVNEDYVIDLINLTANCQYAPYIYAKNNDVMDVESGNMKTFMRILARVYEKGWLPEALVHFIDKAVKYIKTIEPMLEEEKSHLDDKKDAKLLRCLRGLAMTVAAIPPGYQGLWKQFWKEMKSFTEYSDRFPDWADLNDVLHAIALFTPCNVHLYLTAHEMNPLEAVPSLVDEREQQRNKITHCSLHVMEQIRTTEYFKREFYLNNSEYFFKFKTNTQEESGIVYFAGNLSTLFDVRFRLDGCAAKCEEPRGIFPCGGVFRTVCHSFYLKPKDPSFHTIQPHTEIPSGEENEDDF